jgi:hypothetical protein
MNASHAGTLLSQQLSVWTTINLGLSLHPFIALSSTSRFHSSYMNSTVARQEGHDLPIL